MVRVPNAVGFPALDRLRVTEDRIGPVLHDRRGQQLYYAVPTATEDMWHGLPVRVLGRGSWLVAPSPCRSHEWFGRWCELPADDTLTCPDALRCALESAAARALGASAHRLPEVAP